MSSQGPLSVVRDVVLFQAEGGEIPSEELEEMIMTARSMAGGPVGVLVCVRSSTVRPGASLPRAIRAFFARHEQHVAAIVILVEVQGFVGSFFISLGTRLFSSAGLSIPTDVVSSLERAVSSFHRQGLLAGLEPSEARGEIEEVLQRNAAGPSTSRWSA